MPLELNLTFQGREQVNVHLKNSDSGALTFTDPLTPKDHSDIRWYVETYGAHSLGDPDDADAARIKALLPVLGQRLFDAVFSNNGSRRLFDRFLQAEGSTRLLTIIAEHAAVVRLPWELLNQNGTDGGFLFWETPRISIRRRIAGIDEGREGFEVEPKDTLHLLFVVSRPAGSGFLDPRADPGAVLDALDKHAPGRVTIEFLRPPTLETLTRRLEDADARPVDILHFDGHGVLDEHGGLPTSHREEKSKRHDGIASILQRKSESAKREIPAGEPPNTGYLLFEDAAGECDFVSADQLGRNLHRHKVSLVILSACQSAKIAQGRDKEIAEGEARRPMGSVAARLTATGIPAVLAMTHSVLVATTRQLFGRFYEELALHKHLGEALDNARRWLFDHPEKYEVQHGAERKVLRLHDWFLPALYEPGNDTPLLRKPEARTQKPEVASLLTNLPTKPEAGFFGRRWELWQIERWLAGETRRVTVSGFGGQGKTALAQEAGRWLVRTGLFRAAVFVDYARIQSADAVRIAINEIGSVLDQTFADAAEAGAALQQTPTLVILDNLEALAPEPLRALLDTAVSWSKAGGSRVLCTTRQPDFAHEEYRNAGTNLHRRLTLDGLGDKDHPDDALEWFAALSKLPPAPTVPPPDRAAVVALFDEVKFHPLSIRVLAQQLKTERPAKLGIRLGQLLADSALQAAAQKIDDTPAGLFASLQLSLDQLDEKARAVLPRLGVFQGGAFEDDLLAITGLGESDEREQLTALLAAVESGDLRTILGTMGENIEGEVPAEVAAQLRAALPALTADLRQKFASLPPPAQNLWPGLRRQLEAAALLKAESVPEVAVPFLRFHPTLAPLLWAQLPAGERTGLAAAHRQRYAALAHYLYVQDREHPHQARAIARRDLPNLLHAVHAALDAAEPDAVEFANRVNLFLTNFGLRKEAEALLAGARAGAGVPGSWPWYLAQSGRGEQLLASGRIGEAAEIFQGILTHFTTPSCERAVTLGQLGRCFGARGQLDLAAQFQRDAIAMLNELKQTDYVKSLRGARLGDLAGHLMNAGRYAEAREAYEQGLAIFEILRDFRSQGVILGQLGTLAMREANLDEAVRRHRSALALFQQLGEPAMEAVAWHQLGKIFHEAAHLQEAERHFRESARLDEQQGNLAGAAQTWNALAVVSEKAGKPDGAERWYRKAIELARTLDDASELSRDLSNLADLLRTQPGRIAEARELAEEAHALMKTLDPGAAEIWWSYNILAKIADEEAAGASDASQRAQLQAEAREHRRLARETYRAFPGTRTQLRRHAQLIFAAVFACSGHHEARQTLTEEQAEMRHAGGDWANFATALDRLLAGERDAAALCDGLEYNTTALIEIILAGIVDPETLRDFMPEGEDAE